MLTQRLPYDSIASTMSGLKLAEKLRTKYEYISVFMSVFSEIHLPFSAKKGFRTEIISGALRILFETCLCTMPEERPNFVQIVNIVTKRRVFGERYGWMNCSSNETL